MVFLCYKHLYFRYKIKVRVIDEINSTTSVIFDRDVTVEKLGFKTNKKCFPEA